MEADLFANRVFGDFYEKGIEVSRTGSATFAARVVGNLVTGASALGYGIYAAGQGGDGVTDVTIVNNTVTASYHGILINFFDALVANNMVTGNTLMGFSISPTGGSTVVDRNNLAFGNGDDFFGTNPGPGTVLADPLYTNAQDFRPAPNSPGVDAGDDGAIPPEFATDLEGNPRRIGTVDIGAYEAPEASGGLAAIAAAFTLAAFRIARKPR
jgi:hypothetical protein